MNLLQSFKESITRDHLFSSKDRLFIAVSGGMDSVVLCELSFQSGLDFTLVHANFQLRGDESDRDEEFVKELGKKYGKAVVVKRFETQKYASGEKISIQVAARELRYKWFNELIDGLPAYVLTAHHLDDNIETILMNFFKGTGISGLRGMSAKQGRIVRPLLFTNKEGLKQFALAANLTWVEDSSNESDKYSRNYFRHQVIPLIQSIYPGAINNLSNNISRFKDIEILYKQAIDQYKLKLIEKHENEIHIPVLKLRRAEPFNTIAYEIIKDFNFTPSQVGEVTDLLESDTGRYIQSGTHRIIKNRQWLIIAPIDSAKAETILIEGKAAPVEFALGKLHFWVSPAAGMKIVTGDMDLSTALLDADKIKTPLILRRWRTGDYFYPLGMPKKKKIARFLIDKKMSKTQKERVWVLEMDRKIIWILGLRIDDRFKIENHTKNVLKIEVRMT